MADIELIKPRELPEQANVQPTDALMVDNGTIVGKATPEKIVNAGAPVASEAEALAGVNNTKRMTPLRVRQVLDNVNNPAVLRAQAWAESSTPPDPLLPDSKSAKTWASIAEQGTVMVQWSMVAADGQTVLGNDITTGEPIRAFGGVAQISVNGFGPITPEEYSVDSDGVVTLTAPLAEGDVVSGFTQPRLSNSEAQAVVQGVLQQTGADVAAAEAAAARAEIVGPITYNDVPSSLSASNPLSNGDIVVSKDGLASEVVPSSPSIGVDYTRDDGVAFQVVGRKTPRIWDFAGAITDRSSGEWEWDWSEASVAANKWLLRNGGGTVEIPSGNYRCAGPMVDGTVNVPQKWDCKGSTILPDAGVEVIIQSQARANNKGVSVTGITIDGQYRAGTVGVVIRDHASGILHDSQIRFCETGVLLESVNDWSESSSLYDVYVRDCKTGIHFKNSGGTGSMGYFSWGLVHVDYIGGSGNWSGTPIGIHVGEGTNVWVSDIASLVLHVTGATATAMRIDGDASRSVRWRGVVEGFSSPAPVSRDAIHISATGNAFSAEFEMFPLGTWTNIINNQASGTNGAIVLKERGVGSFVQSSITPVLDAYVIGESAPRIRLTPSGLGLGSGSAPPDSLLSRLGANLIGSSGKIAFHNSANRRGTLDSVATGDRDYTFGNSSGRIPAVSAGAPNQTFGLLFMSSGSGAPTGTPADVPVGAVAMYYDTAENKFYIYNGSWRGVILS